MFQFVQTMAGRAAIGGDMTFRFAQSIVLHLRNKRGSWRSA
jgi:hypothetical protein